MRSNLHFFIPAEAGSSWVLEENHLLNVAEAYILVFKGKNKQTGYLIPQCSGKTEGMRHVEDRE